MPCAKWRPRSICRVTWHAAENLARDRRATRYQHGARTTKCGARARLPRSLALVRSRSMPQERRVHEHVTFAGMEQHQSSQPRFTARGTGVCCATRDRSIGFGRSGATGLPACRHVRTKRLQGAGNLAATGTAVLQKTSGSGKHRSEGFRSKTYPHATTGPQ